MKNNKQYKKNNLIIGFSAVILIVSAITVFIIETTEKSSEPVSHTEFTLDTICTITIYECSGNADDIIDGAFDICRELNNKLSSYVSGSDIYNINHSNGTPTTVGSDTAELISDALEYCEMSGGLFDITIFPVKELWDEAFESESLPPEDEIQNAVARVDYTAVKVEGNTVTVPAYTEIDLGAIAKGYIADSVAEYLSQSGVASALINLGGNVYAVGKNQDGDEWTIGIQTPFGESGDLSATVKISNASAVTAGIYQRYFTVDGIIYHHILNADTGMPADTGLYSVTVISENSEQCDALSTICVLLGYEASLDVLQSFSGISAVFITDDFEVIYFDN